MTAQASSRRIRPRAIVTIIRKDMALLGPLAIAGAIGLFVVSALVHARGDIPPLILDFGASQLHVDMLLFGLCAVVLPVAMSLFVILLAQTDVATDMRSDWLVRPVAPLEIVAAKALVIIGAIIAPMVAGDLIYLMLKPGAPDVFETLWTGIGCAVFLLVLSWLVSTPFQAVLAVFGLVTILIATAIAFALAIRVAVGYAIAGDGSLANTAPFPVMADSWILSLASLVGLLAVSGVTLWLLLARRKRAAARWLFAGYFAVSMAVRFLLFETLPDEKPEAAAPQYHAASMTEATMTRHP